VGKKESVGKGTQGGGEENEIRGESTKTSLPERVDQKSRWGRRRKRRGGCTKKVERVKTQGKHPSKKEGVERAGAPSDLGFGGGNEKYPGVDVRGEGGGHGVQAP